MATSLLIDYNILGWAEKRNEQLSRIYGIILKVGTDLPRRNKDVQLAAECKDEDFDLLTSDAKAYTHYFEAGIKNVIISRYDWDEKNDAPVYLIKIDERI